MRIGISRDELSWVVGRVHAAVRDSDSEALPEGGVLLAGGDRVTFAGEYRDPPEPGGILLTAFASPSGGGGLDVECAGPRLSVRARAGADAAVPGRVLADAETLAAVLRELPAGKLEVETAGGRVVLAGGGCRYELPALEEEDFPAVPSPGECMAVFGLEELRQAVARAGSAAGDGEEAPGALECVRVRFDGAGTAVLACTDRYRLAVASCPCRPGAAPVPSAGVLVPARPLAAALASAPAGPVHLSAAGGHAVLVSGAWRAAVPLGQGRFPDVCGIMAGRSPVTSAVTVGAGDLGDALRRVLAAGDRAFPVRLAFTGAGMSVACGDGTSEAFSQDVPAALDGDPARVLLGPRLLLDGLDGIAAGGCDVARITMRGPHAPVVITPAAGDLSGFTYVLMPARDAAAAARAAGTETPA